GDNADLARINEMVAAFADDGWNIMRHNLTMDPNAFVENQTIGTLLVKKGNSVLPITLVDGKVVKMREYPSAFEFSKWFAGSEI
ncbi:MAG: arsenic metallochaperone ArsD family protein, partial [Eubacterium sp.]